MDTRPIGIFDSGSGGLSIRKSITELLPHESIIYIGDHKNIPYSTKTTDFIQKRVSELIRFLVLKDMKMLVIACNTATVAGIDYFRSQFPVLPIIGVVPVIKTASERSIRKEFAVLSTELTAKSEYQNKLIQNFASDCTVHSLGNTELVELIESGKRDSPRVRKILEELLTPLKEHIDVVVLGCTHFPFLRPIIQDVVGKNIAVLDSGEAVARHVKHILNHENILSDKGKPSYQFFTTGDGKKVRNVFSDLIGAPVEVIKVDF